MSLKNAWHELKINDMDFWEKGRVIRRVRLSKKHYLFTEVNFTIFFISIFYTALNQKYMCLMFSFMLGE